MSLNPHTVRGPVPVSSEEIEHDLNEVRDIFTAHERFFKLETSEPGVGHCVVIYGASKLVAEIVERMVDRVSTHTAYGPHRTVIYFRDHVNYERTLTEVKLAERVRELEAKLAETEKRLSDYQLADPACRANGMG